MHIRLGICAGFGQITAPVPGLDYIECNVCQVLCPGSDESAFDANLAAAARSPLKAEAANCLFPGEMRLTGPAVDDRAVDRYIATALKRARRAGMAVLVFGSGQSRQVPEGFSRDAAADQLVAHMKRWAPIAADEGIVIVLEPLNSRDCNIVTTVGEGAALVRRVDHPAIRLLADTYHMARDNDPPNAIRNAAGLIAHVHCAEGNGRGPLGTTGEDQREYFRALKDIGYAGRVSIEANWTNLAAQAAPAMAELRRQIKSA